MLNILTDDRSVDSSHRFLGRFSVRCSSGFSLIEALISLAIFSIAILGLSGLQIRSFGTVVDLNQRSVVTRVMQDYASRVRSNPGATADYTGTVAASLCSAAPGTRCDDRAGATATECSATEIAGFDKFAAFCGLGGSNSGALPGAVIDWSANINCLDGSDCSDANAQMQIITTWRRHKSATDELLKNSAGESMSLVFSP